MMRSMYAAVSCLRNHQTRMDVIGNNIANVNTIGFKKSRVTFKDASQPSAKGQADLKAASAALTLCRAWGWYWAPSIPFTVKATPKAPAI